MNRTSWVVLGIIVVIVIVAGAFLLFMPSQNSSSLYTLGQGSGTQAATDNLGTTAIPSTGTAAPGTSTASTNASPAGSSSATSASAATTPQQNSPSTSANVFSDFKNLINGSPQYMVAYSVSGAGSLNQMTEYVKADKIRTDVTTQGIQAESFILPGGIYSCTMYSGSWTCYTTQQVTTAGNNDVKSHINDYANSVVAEPGMVILGQTTSCYQVTGTNFTSDYCYNTNGVPLYIKTVTPQSMAEFQATAYNGTVADSSFDLPAQPQQMPQAPQGSNPY